MAENPKSTASGPVPVDQVEITKAYLDIPDAENEAMIDARMTYLITVGSAVAFIAAAAYVIFT